MSVSVLDVNKLPLNSCSEKRARLLLKRKRASVINVNPFTIKLLDRTKEDCDVNNRTVADTEKKYVS
jgi:hypothetical protein